MEKQIEDFYRSLRGRRVAFIGTGVTNQQCIELFARCGAQITLCDKKPDIDAFGPYARRCASWTSGFRWESITSTGWRDRR